MTVFGGWAVCVRACMHPRNVCTHYSCVWLKLLQECVSTQCPVAGGVTFNPTHSPPLEWLQIQWHRSFPQNILELACLLLHNQASFYCVPWQVLHDMALVQVHKSISESPPTSPSLMLYTQTDFKFPKAPHSSYLCAFTPTHHAAWSAHDYLII